MVALALADGSEADVPVVAHPGSGPDDEAEAALVDSELPAESEDEEQWDVDESVDDDAMKDMGEESEEENVDSSVDDEADRAANGEEIPEEDVKINGVDDEGVCIGSECQ